MNSVTSITATNYNPFSVHFFSSLFPPLFVFLFHSDLSLWCIRFYGHWNKYLSYLWGIYTQPSHMYIHDNCPNNTFLLLLQQKFRALAVNTLLVCLVILVKNHIRQRFTYSVTINKLFPCSLPLQESLNLSQLKTNPCLRLPLHKSNIRTWIDQTPCFSM